MNDTTQFVKHGLSVPHDRVCYWGAAEGAAHIRAEEVGAVAMATQAIEAITGMLYQHAIDLDEGVCKAEAALKLSSTTTTGLLSALACCAELIDHKIAEGRRYLHHLAEHERAAIALAKRRPADAGAKGH